MTGSKGASARASFPGLTPNELNPLGNQTKNGNNKAKPSKPQEKPSKRNHEQLEESTTELTQPAKKTTDSMNETMKGVEMNTSITPQPTRLPAIKIRINQDKASHYNKNPIKLAEEITRIKGPNLKIKFASFSKTNPTTVFILMKKCNL